MAGKDPVKFSPGAFTPTSLAALRRAVQEKLRAFADIFNIHTGDQAIHTDAADLVKWEGDYFPGLCVPENTLVLDAGWTMISNKDTCEPAAPVAIGDPAWTLDTVGPGWTLQSPMGLYVATGNLYTALDNAYLSGFRFYVIDEGPDIYYTVSLRLTAPDGTETTETLPDLQPPVGWYEELVDAPVLIPSGYTLDLGVQREDRSSTVTNASSWNYTSDNGDYIPLAGEAHRRNNRTWVRFNEDSTAGLQSWLADVVPGGRITTAGGVDWLVSAVTYDAVNGYYEFDISGTGNPANGLVEFTFEYESVAKPQPYYENVDYWVGEPGASGFLDLGGTVTVNENAYAVDILIQPASISDDWDLVSTSLSGPGDSGGGGGDAAVPVGTITMWSAIPTGSATPPTGWALCDGGTHNGVDVPDLADRFIVGVGTSLIDTTGGSSNYTRTSSSNGGHNHGGITGYAGAHSHTISSEGAHTHSTGGPTATVTAAAGGGTVASAQHTHGNTGSGSSHSHSAGTETSHTHTVGSEGSHSHTTDTTPHHYALAYICYVGV